jgi:hypothetical protein
LPVIFPLAAYTVSIAKTTLELISPSAIFPTFSSIASTLMVGSILKSPSPEKVSCFNLLTAFPKDSPSPAIFKLLHYSQNLTQLFRYPQRQDLNYPLMLWCSWQLEQ